MSNYTVYLRIRHPSIDPADITATLGVDPVHAWAAGSAREPAADRVSRGRHVETYWLAPLGDEGWHRAQAAGPGDKFRNLWPTAKAFPLEVFLMTQARLLVAHKEFFARLKSEGASVVLALTLEAEEHLSLELPPALLRSLADLNVGVSIELATETEVETEAELPS
jgi:hypothetical protein